MKKRNAKRAIEEVFDGTASANECTGALQHITIDPDEIAQFHAEYIGEKRRR